MIIVAKIGKPMITARYATSSSTLCDGSQANRSSWPWTQVRDAGARSSSRRCRTRSPPSPTWIVSSGAFWSAGTSGLISDGRVDA